MCRKNGEIQFTVATTDTAGHFYGDGERGERRRRSEMVSISAQRSLSGVAAIVLAISEDDGLREHCGGKFCVS